MIVRPRPSWVGLLFARRGSLMPRIAGQLAFVYALSIAVVAAHGTLFHWKVTLTAAPFSLMGVSLAIFLGFRINASYDRYWEARKLWGGVLVETRNLARHALTLVQPPVASVPSAPRPTDAAAAPAVDADVRAFVLALAGFAASMRNQLRAQPADSGLAALLPEELLQRLPGLRHAPQAVGLWLGQRLREWRAQGRLDAMLALPMEESLDRLMGLLGGCERIANTPLPFTYSVILHRSAYCYCFLLPFGLVDSIGWMTPLVVGFVSYTFFALESLSDEIEEPFGTQPNDLALDAMVVGIESSLRELLGETPPALLRPDDQYLLR
ncbi:bestrophin family protein [Azohydromonas australica]|uniref:bestrophin family protein n=1 Tax=Azohydromonas australica TaxID=364039 RepID=UPI000405217C|nr:bestrophin family ion channel [Azohydromonas australica]